MPGDTPIPLDYADGFTGTGITLRQYGPEWVVTIRGRVRTTGYKAWLIGATCAIAICLGLAVVKSIPSERGSFIGLAGRIAMAMLLGEMFFLPRKKSIEISPSFVTVLGANNPMRKYYWEQKRHRIPRSILHDVKYSTISECLTFRARGREMVELRLFVAPAVGEALARWLREKLEMTPATIDPVVPAT